jgi:outer membrane lipoprotein-sorting protein
MNRAFAFLLAFPLLLLNASADDLHDRFDKAVKQLRSEDAAERDKGSAALEAIAKEAPELVRPLAEDKDPEVKTRALEVLGRLHLLPETAAEALFKKVEKKYAEAKTLQYRAELASRSGATEIIWSLNVASRSPDVFALEGSGTTSSTTWKLKMVGDGKAVRTRNDQGGHEWQTAPPGSGGFVRGGMARVGLSGLFFYLSENQDAGMDDKFAVEAVQAEPDGKVGERPAKVISFTAKVKGEDTTWQEKVWIDAEKEVLLKREATCSDGKTVSETYSNTTFDEEIPDETFALPKEK